MVNEVASTRGNGPVVVHCWYDHFLKLKSFYVVIFFNLFKWTLIKETVIFSLWPGLNAFQNAVLF